MAEFYHIRLETARGPGRPAGDPTEGYDIVAPLDGEGRLDAAAWREAQDRCYARRFSDGQTEARGRLRHASQRWIIDLEPGEAEDAVGYRFGEERFTPGEYVSLTLPDGEQHTYAVVAVQPVQR
ncbi:hypothetical protein [Brevundimonas sp.]|uniref:hypothetical protein n=1 Tax=Brevundimonas sp. TaxID=1871086 RepID=UPI002D5BAE20|nr:hypothetical protein [Brevundimonas sp.]HYC69385.1 hypothetical protein [Brevundimonas sp.]